MINVFFLPGILLLGFVLSVRAFLTTWLRKDTIAFWHSKVRQQTDLSRDSYLQIERRFEEHIPYFRALSDDARSRFIGRAVSFTKDKQFIGMQGFTVTPEVRMLIAAAGVQLTFGMSEYTLPHITHIIVYPKSFIHRLTGQYMKGGVSQKGRMFLSWEDFIAGFRDDNDNFNLGLHEMAHALKINEIDSDRFQSFFAKYIHKWLQLSRPVFVELRHGTSSYLREYGGTNYHEFFAVCVEHFFESPETFSEELPDVYNHLCLLLNQNPLEEDDFRLTDDFRFEVNHDFRRIPIPKKIRYKGFNRFHKKLMYGLIFAPLSVVLAANTPEPFASRMMMNGVALAAVVLIIQVPYAFKRGYLRPELLPIYALSVYGPVALLCLLVDLFSAAYFGL